jgi:phage terminase large subunit-like protein
MINEKPDEDFKYVKVKTLKELNSYIEFFPPILSDDEFDAVSKALIDIHDRNNRIQKNIDSRLNSNTHF